jgi:putative transposase
MSSLFFLLNHLGVAVNISTFSKPFKHRSAEPFQWILKGLQQRLQNRDKGEFQNLFPLDSTIITLTSKLFWQHKIYLDRIITKNENGVRLQIYVVLIGLINYDIYR